MKKLTPREWWCSSKTSWPSPHFLPLLSPSSCLLCLRGWRKEPWMSPNSNQTWREEKNKQTKNPLLIPVNKENSASRNSLNQSHMWTQTQWPFRQFSTNITGFSRHIDFFFLLPIISISLFFFFFKILGMIADLLTRQAGCQKIWSVWKQREIKDIEGRNSPWLVKTNKQTALKI